MEMQIKLQRDTIMYPLEWLKLKADNTKCWQGCGTSRTHMCCCVNVKWCHHFEKLSVS